MLLYGECGTLDIALLAQRVQSGGPSTWAAVALMTTGLLAKTALFPLHLWLPPAHAGAPPAASAVLSALVVKGSFFIVVRLWFDAMPALPGLRGGAAAGGARRGGDHLFGSVVALRQERLKLLIAYSTLAQIGYLFLMFPLAFDAGSGAFVRGDALTGGMLQAISHATAKAAMFMAAGLIYATLGHDRIADLAGAARRVPLSVLAFALGGVALTGVLPSGAYVAKKLLLRRGRRQRPVVVGARAAGRGAVHHRLRGAGALARVAGVRRRACAARARAPLAGSGGARARGVLAAARIRGRGPARRPRQVSAGPGRARDARRDRRRRCGLALALGRRLPDLRAGAALAAIGSPIRRATVAVGLLVERLDFALRRWHVAGLSLVVLTLLFAAAMSGAR